MEDQELESEYYINILCVLCVKFYINILETLYLAFICYFREVGKFLCSSI